MEAQDNSNEPMDVNSDSGNSSSDDDAEEQVILSSRENHFNLLNSHFRFSFLKLKSWNDKFLTTNICTMHMKSWLTCTANLET
jgi:hypothetical protein